ncbi:LamG-like jellyroll fold domain-containing protein [Mangrovicoccus algicola]|uniref:Right-handed parallel beta-helix repeat-containing protein n=1 Tax=Mangrovicoccus algicola TaxID=2771008 RepID=A0A8J6ZAQ1_9RHOB|nr:right-handed parallel beta-helix repeat-containing protein [Mangrovicoccus algicola]
MPAPEAGPAGDLAGAADAVLQPLGIAEAQVASAPAGTAISTATVAAPLPGAPAPSADPASPAQITVSDAAGLAAALATAVQGTVIRLEGGNYGDFALADYAGRVTLLSDPADPAVFSTVQFRNVSGITFDGVTFDYTYTPGDAEFYRPFRFTGCSEITVRNALVDGDRAHGRGDEKDGYGNATGLRFEQCETIRILDSELRGFKDNLQLSDIRDVVVSGNEIHHMREDAIEFGRLTDALFENNYLHDTDGYPLPEGAKAGSGDHPDFFQINGGGARSPCENLVIRGNLMDQGSGTGAQGIFLTNHDDVPWRNITIEDNMYINDRANGIVVGLTDGLVVRNNTILHAFWDTENSFPPTIRLDRNSTDAVVTGNIAGSPAILNLPDHWQTGGNFLLQSTDPDAPGYYAAHFPGIAGALGGNPGKFLLDPASPASLAGAGSPHLYASSVEASDVLIARIAVGATGDADRFVFDAEDSSLPELRVAGPAAEQEAEQEQEQEQEQEMLRFDAAQGDLILRTEAEERVVADFAPGAMALRGLETAPGVLREMLDPLLDADAFRIDMMLGRDPAATGGIAGEVMRLDRAFRIYVTEKGELDFRLKTEDGTWHVLKTSGAGIADGAMHAVSVFYEENHEIGISVDGTVLATAVIAGEMSHGVSERMVIGGQYGATPFAGLLEDLALVLEPGGLQDAPAVALALAEATPAGYDFLWDFGDGSQAQGLSAVHEFDVPGYHRVTLTVSGSDGSVATTDYTVGVAGSDLIAFDAAAGDFLRVSYGETEILADLDPGAVDLRDLDALIRIQRSDLQPMIDAEEFRLDVTLRLDPTETGAMGGEVVRLDRSFVLGVSDAGEVDLRLKTTDGIWHRLVTKGAGIGDGESHEVSLRFDAGDLLELAVDDIVLAASTVAGGLEPGIGSSLVIGGQYGARAFGGFLEDMAIDLQIEEELSAQSFETAAALAAGDWAFAG